VRARNGSWPFLAKNTPARPLASRRYGEIGIDDGLVVDTKEEIFEMNNGCVCCTGGSNWHCHRSSVGHGAQSGDASLQPSPLLVSLLASATSSKPSP
jgi:hypothetical protein